MMIASPTPQGLAWRKPTEHPGTVSAARDTKMLEPAYQRPGDPIDLDHLVPSRIPVLLSPRCPTTVPGLVVPIVVDPVERVPIRAFPHIGKEVVELMPPGAQANASPAVVFPGCAVAVCASLLHRRPSPVFVGPVATPAVAVSERVVGHHRHYHTTTRRPQEPRLR